MSTAATTRRGGQSEDGQVEGGQLGHGHVERVAMRTRGARRPVDVPPMPYDGAAVTWHPLVVRDRGERLAHRTLRQLGFASFYAWYHAPVRIGRGRAVVGVMRPRWPGYLLLGLGPQAPLLDLALAAPGVVEALGYRDRHGEPQLFQVKPDEVAALRRICDADGRLLEGHRPVYVEGRALFREGARVRITGGPFCSFEAVVLRDRKATLWVAAEIFGRETRVELLPQDVEPLDG